MSTYLYKPPSNRLVRADGSTVLNYAQMGYTTQVFEWASSSTGGGVIDYRTSPHQTYPFTTTMTLIVETGFSYYLIVII